MQNLLANEPFPPFPAPAELETDAVLRQVISASRPLAELKSFAATSTTPGEGTLINLLTLLEAKDSSAIEGIVTTHDELYKAGLSPRGGVSAEASAVYGCADALRQGFQSVRESGVIRLEDILAMQRGVEKEKAGLRRLPGTVIKNLQSGEIIHTPPQNACEVKRLTEELVDYINNDHCDDVDPLVKMAFIHHRFESIHPFYDGNGRTGRMLNILYLVAKGLLGLPVLYLSFCIARSRPEYYRQLGAVRTNETWEPWLLYMLEGVERSARYTIRLIEQISGLMQDYKHRIRKELPKIYSRELLHHLFRHVYTKRGFVIEDLDVSYITATKYLNQLVERGFLEEARLGRSNYYVNRALFEVFQEKNWI